MRMAKKNLDYDIGAAFEVVENELMASMIRNMQRHKVEEVDEGKQWTMWQTEMLKSLEQYKKKNQAKYSQKFKDINAQIEALIRAAKDEGEMDQEIQILKAIQKGFPAKKIKAGAAAEFFRVNDRKLDALIEATMQDMQKAETAILRMTNDQYRKIIYNAQVYANTGAGAYEKAVDMATRDFLSAGINCIEYSNGARHTLADYADMAIRTASKRAYLQGEGQKRQEWGVDTVIINKRGNPCPLCLPWVGKVLIDDVWSGGSKTGKSATTGIKYPLMSTAIAAGLYHPRCRDSHTTYFEGISTQPDEKYTKEELNELAEKNQQVARQQYAERQEKRFGRLADFSLDPENQQKYEVRREEYSRLCDSESLRADPEYQDSIRKRREAYFKRQAKDSESQFDRNALKMEIAGKTQKKSDLQKELLEVEGKEKELTQKVYFDLTGTAEEAESLKSITAKKKVLESRISDVQSEIWNKQETYKNNIENGLIQDKILKKVKLSKRMTPETVDQLEQTIRDLHSKYGMMPDVVFSPMKVENAVATYNWLDDTIYISNDFNDSKEYLKKVLKSEESLVEYNAHYDIKNKARQKIQEAEEILKDKSVKGYEREKARLKKVLATVQTTETRTAVRENVTDCFVHEYGHFIHRHANADYVQKKNVFGMKELGGSLSDGDWEYDINKKYSSAGKIRAAAISRYADSNPYETFAEGFLAMEKGEEIPEQIAQIIEAAKQKAGAKEIAKSVDSDIMELTRKTSDSRKGFKFISDKTFDNLTIAAKKKGAVILRGTEEVERHLDSMNAAASNLNDILFFRKDVCISEVLEETHHFEQNLMKMNDDKEEPLRSILNEIDAKQYLLDNAEKYKIPRNEIELTKKQLASYQQQLKEITGE